MLRTFAFVSLLALLSCTSNESNFSDKVIVDPVGAQENLPKYAQSHGTFATPGGGVDWYTCTQNSSAGSIVMLNPGPKKWAKEDACGNPAAIEFLGHGWNVIAISRPAKEVLGDDASLEQIKETVEFLQKEDRRLEGLWSMGQGSIMALRLARQFPWKLLIIGNGIYDWELTLKESTDPDFLAKLKELPGSAESSFAEKRSAAWDLSALPKQIYLYHSGKNTQVLPSQAVLFKSSLAASEYKVELFVLDEDTNEIRPEYHRGVLNKIFQSYQKPN